MLAHRHLLALSPFAAALVAVGCGGASNGTASPTAKLIAYSKCMRAHDVPKFPDPDRQGNLLIGPASGIDPNAPQYVAAERTCAKLLPSGTANGMTPQQQAQAFAQLTRYAQCMREHGVPMANPFKGPNGGVGYSLPRNTDLGSAVYKQAAGVCRHLLPAG